MTQSTSRKFLIGGNWKCNGTKNSVTELCQGLSKIDTSSVDVVVSPISLHLQLTQTLLEKCSIFVACQNISATGTGAYTGEIAPTQLPDFGISWAIVGHSERRKYYGETDSVVTQKITNGLSASLNLIACLGETQTQRDNKQVKQVITTQLNAIIKGVTNDKHWANMVIAYEPVWAIGTGNTCSPKDAQEVCQLIRGIVSENVSKDVAASVRILYGGSVKPKNALELIQQPDIDGFLVGGASLKAQSFGEIIGHVRSQSKL
jgi:triosephosphate isomerase